MSRVGKQPVVLPSGVKAAIVGDIINIEGPRGKLSYRAAGSVKVLLSEGKLVVQCGNVQDRQANADYGSTRAHLNNMVFGVTKGWKRSLELSGVGYSAKVQGQTLTLVVGLSHDVEIILPKEIKCSVNKTTIDLESNDVQLLGMIAAKIRASQPPEPYLGKGIKYSDEKIRRKAGKAVKKAA